MLPDKTDVVIVGAGPTGLALGIGLARRGIDFTIVDALLETQNTSRAAVIHARTLETLVELGVGEELIAQGVKVPHFRIRDRSDVLLYADFRLLKSETPFLLMIPQDESEAILIQRLAEMGHQVKRPVKVARIETLAEGALVHCETAEGSHVIETRYVAGADGQHSRVRDNAAIAFRGETYGSFMLADVRMEWPLTNDEVTLFFSEEGTLVVAPMSKDRFRIVAQLAGAPSQPTIADVQKIIDARGPTSGAKVTELLWGSRFQVHHKLAERFRAGPLILAGDAAHVHSPAGGQGMNLGIRDAAALAGALAETITGNAGEAPLDRYAEARRTAAEEVLAMTDRLTKAATLKSRSLRRLRNLAIAGASRIGALRRTFANRLAGYN